MNNLCDYKHLIKPRRNQKLQFDLVGQTPKAQIASTKAFFKEYIGIIPPITAFHVTQALCNPKNPLPQNIKDEIDNLEAAIDQRGWGYTINISYEGTHGARPHLVLNCVAKGSHRKNKL